MRRVIAHLHLFKNAGTSVERGLRANFGSRWVSYDKTQSNARISVHELANYLVEHPHIGAISSHQLRPPLDSVGALVLDPLVFLRNPIDRIRSAYEFERTQAADTPSATAARSMDFIDWIDFHHARGSSQCANFQCMALTALRADNGAPRVHAFSVQDHLESAIATLDQLPVIGLVEHYDASCAALTAALASVHPGFELQPTRANTTAGGKGLLDVRLKNLSESIGQARFDALVEMNRGDLELWQWATARLARTSVD